MNRSRKTACRIVSLLLLFTVFGLWSISTSQAEVCIWSNSTDVPIQILGQATVSQGSFLYTFGGVVTGPPVAHAYSFDGTTWTPISPLPTVLFGPTAVSDGTYIYILGGSSVGTTNQTSVYRYDPAADIYLAMAPFTTGTAVQATAYLDGKIYKFAGSDTNNTSTSDLEIYDVATNSWSMGAPYPIAVSFLSSFVNDGFVYGAGGFDFGTNSDSLKTYRYDPVLDTWDDASIADLPYTRWGAASSETLFGPGANGGWVLAGGFENGSAVGNTTQTAIRWDPLGNTWDEYFAPGMTFERALTNGAQMDGSFYVIGGRSIASFDGTVSNQKLICLENVAIISNDLVTFVTETCPNNAFDPGETLTVSLPLMNSGDIPTVALTVTLQATGGVINPGEPVNFGAVPPDRLPVSRNFTFTVDPNLGCGDSITLTWTIVDGATSHPDAVQDYVTGVPTVTLLENFDGVSVNSLPVGWSNTQTVGLDIDWRVASGNSNSPPNAAYANGWDMVNAAALSTPAVLIESPVSQLTFKNRYDSEGTYDGCVLEYSIDGGVTWTDVIIGGGSFVSGGYNWPISANYMSPIGGRMAWSGDSGGYIDSVVNLPASLNGQNVMFRWLFATDRIVSSTGHWIDDVQIIGGRACCQIVAPESVTVTRGTHVSGDAAELAASDNADLSVTRATSDVQSRTEFTVKAFSPVAFPSSLAVTLEGSVFARSPVNQTIELLAIDGAGHQDWEQIDSRAATRFTDSTVTVVVNPAVDLSRYVDPITMCIEARVRYQSVNPRQQFSSNTDQFIWAIGQ